MRRLIFTLHLYLALISGVFVFILGATGAIMRLVNLNRAIHTGDIFGLPSKFVMSLASLALAVQAVAGVMMWLKRRASRASAPEPAEASRELQQS